MKTTNYMKIGLILVVSIFLGKSFYNRIWEFFFLKIPLINHFLCSNTVKIGNFYILLLVEHLYDLHLNTVRIEMLICYVSVDK